MIALERVTAVVVNWRTPDLTLRAVHALVDDGLPADRVVVVDNASADGSAARLRGELAGSTVVELPENVGFARGNNDGVRRLPGEAYLLVNSDAFVDRPGSLRALTGALDDPTVGIVAARLLNEDGTRAVERHAAALALGRAGAGLGPEPFRPGPLAAPLEHVLAARRGALGRGCDRCGAARSRRRRGSTCGGSTRPRSCTRRTATSAGAPNSPAGTSASCRRRSSCTWAAASVRTRWDDAARAERVASAEAAMVRRHRGRVSAGATLGIMLAGYRARAAAMRLAGRPERAAVFAASARGLRRPPAPPATLQPPAARTDETG